MITLKERIGGVNIYNACYIELKLPFFKLVSVATDGTFKAMVGCVKGYIALCRKHEEFSHFLYYHCIIQQQVFSSKRLNTKEVMDIRVKIANSFRANAFESRLFRQEFDGQKLPLMPCSPVA